jgi:hypothetical protein
MATLPVAFPTQNEEALARAAHLETFLALTATQGKPPAFFHRTLHANSTNGGLT